MSFFNSDRLLWTVVLVGIGTTYYIVPALLQQVKETAKAPQLEPPQPAKRLQRDSENSLSIETLRTLSDGHSYELRTSAIKIVANRTIRSPTKILLFRDLACKDYARRDNAINGLWMLLYHPALSDTKVSNDLTDFRAVTAVVQALINVLPDHDINGKKPDTETDELPPSPIKPMYRPAHEVSLLIVLNHMFGQHISNRIGRERVNYAMNHALRAGLVTKWLIVYPFPCSLPENSRFNFKRPDVARLFERTAWASDDPLMAVIVREVMNDPVGRKQMLEAGLKGANYNENLETGNRWHSQWQASSWNDDDDDDMDVPMTDGEDTAGIRRDTMYDQWEEVLPPIRSFARRGSMEPDHMQDRFHHQHGGGQSPVSGQWDDLNRSGVHPRPVERSQEEEHLRRRHREAIVVAERGTPLRRENILQREDSQIGLQPMNGVSEVEGVLNNLLNLSDSQHVDAHDLEAEALDLTAPDDPRVAAEIDRSMDTREIEQLIEQSITDPDLRRAIEILDAPEDGVATLVADQSGNDVMYTTDQEGNEGA